MPEKNKPISASNPPESRGNRGAKDQQLLVLEETGEEAKEKEAVSQPTNVEPSPKKSTTRTSKQPTTK